MISAPPKPIQAIPLPALLAYIAAPVDIIVQETEAAAAEIVARFVAHALRDKPDLVLGLATGRTMELVYRNLVRRHREEGLDFSQCHTFNLDEYVGLSTNDPHSFHAYMRRHLFDQVNIPAAQTHLPNGAASDLEAECEDYEARIAALGGIDLQLLGIGLSGHIGFNEPLSSFTSRTRVERLAPETLAQNGPAFGGADRMPREAITMGVETILEAHRCILLAAGHSKAEVIASALEGPVTSMISATALRGHPRCTVVLDDAAAGRLRKREDYALRGVDPLWRDILCERPHSQRHAG